MNTDFPLHESLSSHGLIAWHNSLTQNRNHGGDFRCLCMLCGLYDWEILFKTWVVYQLIAWNIQYPIISISKEICVYLCIHILQFQRNYWTTRWYFFQVLTLLIAFCLCRFPDEETPDDSRRLVQNKPQKLPKQGKMKKGSGPAGIVSRVTT